MSSVDPMFKSLPKNSTFFTIWRIEKMQLVQLPKDSYGYFFNGDSYIVAVASDSTEKPNCYMKSKKAVGNLDIHIHFWLGSQTSQDEAGVAAFKTVELDDFLAGAPVQHREVQGFESQRFLSYFPRGIRPAQHREVKGSERQSFLSYFPHGIRIQNGGVASGLTHVEDQTVARMYHVKGKRRPIVKELPGVGWSHMNDGDVFIIDARTIIFVWTGRYANHVEKIQGAVTAQQIKGEHGEGTIVIVEDGQEKLLGSPEKEYFNHLLPLEDKLVRSHREVLKDDASESQHRGDVKLYRCSDEGGTLRVTEVKAGPLDQKDLNTQDSYIIDNAESGIWVWVGKKASHKERTEAMRNAQGFIKKKGYPHCTQVARVVEGGEPTEFKCLFRSWNETVPSAGVGKTHSATKIAKTVQTKFDACTLQANPNLAAQMQVVDNGTGKKEVFRVKNLELVPIDVRDHGRFFSSSCYVIAYVYESGAKEEYIIYSWLGKNSTSDEHVTAEAKALELDDRFSGQAVLVRLAQGHETPHFMMIFAGQMIVFEDSENAICNGGGMQNGNTTVDWARHATNAYLLQVHGTTEHNTKAVQVPFSAASLNSGDVFLLFCGSNVYLWAGRKSTGDEREMAKKIATGSGREMILVSEGQEKQEFWDAIGGKLPYNNEKNVQEESGTRAPRLFHLWDIKGNFAPREVVDFEQSDLLEDEVMLLDAWHTLFLWIGYEAKKEHRKLAYHSAEEYLRTDPSGRAMTIPVACVKQNVEPPNFIGLFSTWNEDFWKTLPTYQSIKNQIEESNQTALAMQQQAAMYRNSRAEVEKFPFDKLHVKNPEQLPSCVDPANKELYLNDEDFERIFAMTYEQFDVLPRWKKLDLKKKVGLF